jgi:hypothetical protein
MSHPAKKSRILALLASIGVLFVQVAAMTVNTDRNNSVSEIISPTPVPIPTPSKTKVVKAATPVPKVTKITTKKTKVHVVTSASPKKKKS